MSDFIDKFRKLRGLSNLEIAIRGAKGDPIPNLGELVEDYIDTKGDKYDPKKLMSIFAPRGLKPSYVGKINPETEPHLQKNRNKMLASISALMSNPEYADKMEYVINLNKNTIDPRGPEYDGHVFSALDDMEESLELQRKITNRNPLRPTPKPY